MTAAATATDLPVCVVVGSGPGLGAALARRFASGGHRVALLGRNTGRLSALSTQLSEAGCPARAVTADAGSDASLRAALDEVTATWAAPTVLLYNAAAMNPAGPLQISVDQLRAHGNTDYVGALLAAQVLAPAMVAAGRGTMLFTGGALVDTPTAAVTGLSVGKAALRALVCCLSEELAPQGVHAASVTIAGQISPGGTFDPDRIAAAYWDHHTAPASRWQAEYRYEEPRPDQ